MDPVALRLQDDVGRNTPRFTFYIWLNNLHIYSTFHIYNL